MSNGATPSNARTLSYLTLRKFVGWVALLLPFALTIPYRLLTSKPLETSLSAYYYTGMRNVFVGSLCAIAVVMICCRGFDTNDFIAGIVAAVCAFGVAFCPMTPPFPAPAYRYIAGHAHYYFASALFLTLAVMCLFLFTRGLPKEYRTKQKNQRNVVYYVCGIAILISLACALALRNHEYVFGKLGTLLCFESTSLWFFGAAWLVKGELILKDRAPGVTPPASPNTPA
jgi:hypothetical protein